MPTQFASAFRTHLTRKAIFTGMFFNGAAIILGHINFATESGYGDKRHLYFPFWNAMLL
jgi:hypothetical protein